MAKQSRKSEKKTMSSNDALAALGLEEEVAVETVAPAAEVTETVAPVVATEAADREEVDVGTIELGTIDYIPTMKRTAGGSKYKFDELKAPGTDANGKPAYSFFFVAVGTNEEAKLKRSVQSATTQANKQSKDEGKYFITRTKTVEGKFAGMLVIRTDDRPAVEDESAEA